MASLQAWERVLDAWTGTAEELGELVEDARDNRAARQRLFGCDGGRELYYAEYYPAD